MAEAGHAEDLRLHLARGTSDRKYPFQFYYFVHLAAALKQPYYSTHDIFGEAFQAGSLNMQLPVIIQLNLQVPQTLELLNRER